MAKIRVNDGYGFVITENNGYLQALNVTHQHELYHVELDPFDWYAIMDVTENSIKKVEYYYGNGYMSQNSRHFSVNNEIQGLNIYDYQARSRNIVK